MRIENKVTGRTRERYTEDRLDKDHQPKRFYAYYVTGSGDFPFDMLRYDAAWPVTSVDAAKLSAEHKRRSVKLHSYQEPTVDRWSSFLWSVGTEDLATGAENRVD